MTEWAVWIIIGLAAVLLIIITLFYRREKYLPAREIDAFTILQDENLASLEKGKRFIYALGSQGFLQDMSISDLVGLPVLSGLTRQTVFADQAPLVINGDGSLAGLSQMILSGVYKNAMVPELFSMDCTQFGGTTGMAYLGSVLPEVNKNINGGLVMVGQLRPELALAVDLADRHEIFTVAASESPASQALLCAVNCKTVIGEQYYAANAALNPRAVNIASMRTQDFLRFLIIIAMIIGAIAKALGLF